MDDDDRTQLPPSEQLSEWAKADMQASAASANQAAGSEPQALPSGTRLHEFEVLGLLGRGGFSMVYRARDHSLQREVAVKEFLPMNVAMRTPEGQVQAMSDRHSATFQTGLRHFVEEAETLARFDHPALVRVHRIFRANGTAYMVMQMVKGSTLDAVARALPGPPDEAWLLRLLDPLTAALQVVHGKRIIHRDIAADNIMMLEGGLQPLLLDFGAAREVIPDSLHVPTSILKLNYAPIEQFPDSGLALGPWTDVYSLAGVVHRLIAGSAPPNSQRRLIHDDYKSLALRLAGSYSQHFLQAIDHGLALRPENRTSSVAAFRQELGLPADGQAQAPPSPTPTPTAVRGMPKWAFAALGSLVLAGGLTAYLLPGTRPASRSPPSPIQARADSLPVNPPSTPEAAASPPGTSHANVAPPSISQTLDQLLAARTPEFGVSLKANRTTMRATPDNTLELRLSSATDGYFVVLAHDTDDEVRVLFPNASEPGHRIKAGRTVTLPPPETDAKTGLSRTKTLWFDKPGQLRLLAIVTTEPLDLKAAVDRMDSDYPRLLKGRAAADAQASQAGRPLYLGRTACEPGPTCDQRHDAAELALPVKP